MERKSPHLGFADHVSLNSCLMPRLPRLSQLPDSLTEEEFWDAFGDMEHEQLDFKASAHHIKEAIAAMAMTDGGLLVLGVSDDREIIGRALNQSTLDMIMRAGHGCGVTVQVKEMAVDGTKISVVAVPEVRGHIITTPDGRLLRRLGSDNQPLIGDALGRFVREREERPAEDEAALDIGLDEINLELVNRALVNDGRPRVTRRGLMRALTDLGVAKIAEPPLDPHLLRAGLVLFGAQPSKYVPGAAVQLVRREGVGPGPGAVRARQEVSAPIPMVLDAALAFIDANTSRHEAVVGTHRETFAEYPPAVLREAVLNALAHRDYGLEGATVDITIWDDRIEVRSPGPLPGHITSENMREEHYSRNRRIMRVLKLLALVEDYGEGIDRMFNEMEARLMEPPHFVATTSSVTVTLYNRSLLSIDDQAWLALLGHLDLTGQERRALVIARHDGGVTPRRLRKVFGDQFDVDSVISGAVAKGVLVRVGRGGGARYILSDEVVTRAGGAGVEARSRKRQTLLDEIRRRESLSTAEATDFLGESDRLLVRGLLDDLVRTGDAVARGRTRARRYHAAGARRARAAS